LAAQLATLYKSRADKEAALRALTADTLKTEDQAATEARNNAAKIRADITARDKEATALREKLAGLNRQRAEIDYQIQLAEFQLREGVGRRISFDPEVRNAEAAAANADNARRAKEASAPAIAVARGELDALRRQIQETEASANAAPEVVAARAALAAKEKAFNELRAKIQADAVAGLRAAVEGAAKEEEALRAKKLAEDEEAKGLGSAKAEAGKERAAAGARRQEIDAAMNKLYEQTAEADAVKAARDAALAAAKAYDEAYAASEVQKLMETARAASKALADKTAELRAADAVCTELGARIGEARQKAADISRQIKSLSK
jgi:colicin import membrane protein